MTEESNEILAENVEKNTTDNKRLSKLWHSFNSLLGIGAIAFASWSHFSQPDFIAFDIKGTTDVFLQQLQQSNLDSSEKSKRVKRFEQALQLTISDYKKENTIILVKAAVISNIPDKTSEIKKRIAQRMKSIESNFLEE